MELPINQQLLLLKARMRRLGQSLQLIQMDKIRGCKPSYEKENQSKLVNKKADLISSLHNIKLPLQPIHNFPNLNFNSLSLTSSLDCSYSSLNDNPPKKPKQTSNTEQYFRVYGSEVENLLAQEESKGKFLGRHKIDGALRARMLDWMVEVMSSYNFQHKTYFAGVEIMDRFFAASPQVVLPNRLHILGVQSMFVAAKMEEVYPLKMKTVYDKIAHKKIPVVDLVNMEKEIIEALNFELTSNTFYDLAITRISKDFYTNHYSQELLKEIQDVCSCLAKLMCYNYKLVCQFDKETKANTLFKHIMKIYKLPCMEMSREEEECQSWVVETVGSFKQQFKGLNNILKFTDKKVFEIIEHSFF